MNNEISRTVRVKCGGVNEYGNPSLKHVAVSFSRENGQWLIGYTMPPLTESEYISFSKYLVIEISKYKKAR